MRYDDSKNKPSLYLQGKNGFTQYFVKFCPFVWFRSFVQQNHKIKKKNFNKTIKLRKKLQKRALRFLDNDCISSCGQLLEKLSKTIAIVKMFAIIVPSV